MDKPTHGPQNLLNCETFKQLVLEGHTVRYIRTTLDLAAGSDADYVRLMLKILRGET